MHDMANPKMPSCSLEMCYPDLHLISRSIDGITESTCMT